jgi:hypothetical protein
LPSFFSNRQTHVLFFFPFYHDCTKYCYIYLFKNKDESLEIFKHYKNKVENQFNETIKVIKSDRGGEHEHHLVNYVPKMILSTKLLLLIHYNKMTLQNIRTEH